MTDFPRQIKQEAVGSEEEPSFGASQNQQSAQSAESGASRQPGSAVAVQEQEARLSSSAVKLLSDRYPSFFAHTNNTRSKSESKYVLTILMVITALVLATWSIWDPRYFHTDSDLIYYMGLYGGILMLFTLLYSFRKRVGFMRNIGQMATWYYMHLVAGVVGPVLVILHSSFTMRSLNSSVAMIAMLCVIASGIFGRYIYTRIGYRVHRHLMEIRDTEQRLETILRKYEGDEVTPIEKSLSVLTVLAVNMPQSLFRMPGRFVALRGNAAKCYINGIRDLTRLLKQRAQREEWDRLSFHAELAKQKRILRNHINALVKIGQFHFYERLLVGWRIFHVPLIFILVISGSVHVWAVHWY
jgi:hypothetical protein